MSEFTCTLWSKSIASSADIVLAGEQQEDAKVGNSSDFLGDPSGGGGFKHFFFHPENLRERIPKFDDCAYFYKKRFGEKPPTRCT